MNMYDALLFRLNPIYWPYWHDDIAQDHEPYPLLEVGPHLERSKLCAGIPVIALGTDGLGIVLSEKRSQMSKTVQMMTFVGWPQG